MNIPLPIRGILLLVSDRSLGFDINSLTSICYFRNYLTSRMLVQMELMTFKFIDIILGVNHAPLGYAGDLLCRIMC